MGQHQVGDDVAGQGSIAIGVKQPSDGVDLGRPPIEHGNLVSEVFYRARVSGHEPSAKTPLEWSAVIDVAWHSIERAGLGARGGEHQQTGNAERVAGHVAAEALELPRERRPDGLAALFESVED